MPRGARRELREDGPTSESHRGGTERLGQPPRRPGHAGAAVTREGRGRTEGGSGQPPAAGQILRGRGSQRGAPAPRRGRCVLSAQFAASPLRPGPRLRGRIHERAGQPPPPPPRSGAGSAPGRRKAGRRAGRARPDRPFPRSPRHDSVPSPAPPPSGPAGSGQAGPGLAATQRRGLPALTSIARPAESGPRPPAPSASAGPGSAAAASPRRGPGIAEAPPLAAAPPRLTAGGGRGAEAVRCGRAPWGRGSVSASGGACPPA